mmetsp:Transcript_10780/g.27768  ORF Transcript_10780/g.27768 Transcript_10780/m.27768 type:complete len:248 (+) Transcript_10780:600-1343(+)
MGFVVVPTVGALVDLPQAERFRVHHRPYAIALRRRRHLCQVLSSGMLGVEVHADEELTEGVRLGTLHLYDPLVLRVILGIKGFLEVHDRVRDDLVPTDDLPLPLQVASLLRHDPELQGIGIGAAEASKREVVVNAQAVDLLHGTNACRAHDAGRELRVVVHRELVEGAGHLVVVEARLDSLALDARVLRALLPEFEIRLLVAQRRREPDGCAQGEARAAATAPHYGPLRPGGFLSVEGSGAGGALAV